MTTSRTDTKKACHVNTTICRRYLERKTAILRVRGDGEADCCCGRSAAVAVRDCAGSQPICVRRRRKFSGRLVPNYYQTHEHAHHSCSNPGLSTTLIRCLLSCQMSAEQFNDLVMLTLYGPGQGLCPRFGVGFHRVGATFEVQFDKFKVSPAAGPTERG